jgi:hydroxymethylglutaryl-CoA reductase (NADPH)
MKEDELVEKIVKGEVKLYEVERYTDDDKKAGTEARRKAIEKITGEKLDNIGRYSIDPNKVMGRSIENMIGVVQMPLGIAGPVKLNGEHAEGLFHIPLATTEGALVASVSRGCSAITKSGGAKSFVIDNKTTRAPAFKAKTAEDAVKFIRWVNEHKEELKAAIVEGERFMKIKDVKPYIMGRTVWLRIMADTGDAMGMNMVTIGAEKGMKWIKENQKFVVPVATSGNMCSDKKACALNMIEGRGKTVVSEVIIPKEVVEKVFKTTPEGMVEVNYRKNLLGSALAGSYGFNAHFANMVAAFFIATGQDAAHVVDGSLGFTTVELNPDRSLHVAVTIPDVMIAAIGGGTHVPCQNECLKILGIEGGGDPPGSNGIKIAEVLGAAVLAGELSLVGAISAGHLAGAHARLGR